MKLTDPGFLLLILPGAAALYSCCPRMVRPAVLCLLSLFSVWLFETEYAVWLILSLIFDAFGAALLSRRASAAALCVYYLAIVKNCAVLLLFGVLRPLISGETVWAGVLVLHLAELLALVCVRRGKVDFSSPLAFCSYAAMPGRLPFGPLAVPYRMRNALLNPRCSFMNVGEGALLILFGTAKRLLLAEQLFALYKTLLRIPSGQLSVAAAWLAALCPAMGIAFVFSAYSDIALGIGKIFGVDTPRMTYYPFQARGARDSVYRLNMGLEDGIGILLGSGAKREENTFASIAASLITPFALAMLIGMSENSLLWAVWLAAVVAADIFLQAKLRINHVILRIAGTVCLLPSYVLLSGTRAQQLSILRAMVGLDGVALVNEAAMYQAVSNLALLVISVLLSTSLLSVAQRSLRQRLPHAWWAACTAAALPLGLVTLSFMIRNVR